MDEQSTGWMTSRPDRVDRTTEGRQRTDGPSHLPVIELSPDLRPERAAERLRSLTGLAFLDSSRPDDDRGRFSYVTADPFLTLECRGQQVTLTDWRGPRVIAGDPLTILQELLQRYRLGAIDGLPPFQGGAVGYVGYDLGRQLERLPSKARDDLGLPELRVGFYDWVVAWDHARRKTWLFTTCLPDRTSAAARARVVQIKRLLDTTPPTVPSRPRPAVHLHSNFTRSAYLETVRRAQQAIADGEIYQVNLSQRFSAPWEGDPWDLYQSLRVISPVPYGAYLEAGDAVVLSASPECFLRFDRQTVETSPIKGTCRRGVTPAEDDRLAAELGASVKDRAENLMIVDLLRNDLGKVCRVGSIRVPRLFAIEGYSHVWQLVSTVVGEISPDRDAVDLLRACFPGGSVTGCPKIRAMEIIEELEPVRRGIYCGVIGYLSFGGAMTTSIVIRTILLKDRQLHLQVGGAVVADSDPAAEYAETLAKAAAPLAALAAEVEE